MKIEINEQRILTEILERDGTLHEKIKDEVRNRLVDKLVDDIERKFINQKWDGSKEIEDSVLDDLQEKQTEIIKKILSKFYDSYRFGKKELSILKKLKEFLGEN